MEPDVICIKRKNIKIILKVVLAIIIGSIFYYLFFYSPSKNYDTAFIEKTGTKYKLTLLGERSLMVHDPISALKGETYLDIYNLLIPRNNGLIKAEEITKLFKLGGSDLKEFINIKNDKVFINLYYDDSKSKPSTWNGEYNLSLIDHHDYY